MHWALGIGHWTFSYPLGIYTLISYLLFSIPFAYNFLAFSGFLLISPFYFNARLMFCFPFLPGMF